MHKGLIPYDVDRHSDPLPGPLNGPSMALGTREDLLRLVARLDLVDQDVVLMNRLDGTSQLTLSHVLDVRTQAGISHRLSQATRCLRHLALEPVPTDLVVRRLLPLVPAVVRGPLWSWARGTHKAASAMREHGVFGFKDPPAVKAQASALFLRSVRKACLSLSDPDVTRWVAWRLAMPQRYDMQFCAYVKGRQTMSRIPTPEQEDVIRSLPVVQAALALGLSRNRVNVLRRAAGISGHARRDLTSAMCDPALSVREAARLAGVSRPTARSRRRKAGISPGVSPPKITVEEAKARLAPHAGKTQAEIARACGVTNSTVHRWATRAAGLPIKRYGRKPKM